MLLNYAVDKETQDSVPVYLLRFKQQQKHTETYDSKHDLKNSEPLLNSNDSNSLSGSLLEERDKHLPPEKRAADLIEADQIETTRVPFPNLTTTSDAPAGQGHEDTRAQLQRSIAEYQQSLVEKNLGKHNHDIYLPDKDSEL